MDLSNPPSRSELMVKLMVYYYSVRMYISFILLLRMAAEFYSVLMLESMYLFLFGWGAKC